MQETTPNYEGIPIIGPPREEITGAKLIEAGKQLSAASQHLGKVGRDAEMQLRRMINALPHVPDNVIVEDQTEVEPPPAAPIPVELMRKMKDYATRYKKANPRATYEKVTKAVQKKFPYVKIQA